MSKRLIFIALLLLLAAVPAYAGIKVPFGPGERLTYRIYWTFVHAGDAVLEVLPDTDLEGVPACAFRATARTVPWVDKFYKVRDTLESWTDPGVNHSLRYKKEQNEGSYHKQVDLEFDPEARQTRRYVWGELKHTLDQPAQVFDPMSILFGFRKQPFYKTMRFAANVTDGKVSVVGESLVEGKEDVKTPLGIIPCYRVRIDVKHLSGVFRKSRDAELLVWFSADNRRIPVKVRSKVVVGHFTMELVDYQPPDSIQPDRNH
ncbi:DUF3108 domain-containing protein [Pseudodesulfovibrio sp.]|uniref:DUF3108 domain-containing protein n=1 Tax=unclassified Pseudodesulfovibrio TaxID=2661612 RepID=UPI003B002C04